MRISAPLTTCLFTALFAGAAFAQAPVQAPKKGSTNSEGAKITPKEAQAVQAVIQAQTQSPDDMIKAVDDLVSKFADTMYKSFALELEAEAYQKKGDNAKAIVYAEQALQADPKNFDADNVLANILAATTRDTDLDKEEKLTRAEKYAHDSLAAVDAGKPALFANATDEQWAKSKGSSQSLAYQALGTVALVRKKNDEAVADFEKGIAANPDPVLMLRAGRALYTAKKYDEAVAYDEKVMNAPDAPQNIRSIAQADRARAIQAKGPTAAAPAAPK